MHPSVLECNVKSVLLRQQAIGHLGMVVTMVYLSAVAVKIGGMACHYTSQRYAYSLS
jgi:hypothetical protein